MNCLKIDLNKLNKKKIIKIRDFEYNFLNILKEYKIPIEIYYKYLLSLENFKLKNVWNNLVKKWNSVRKELKENQSFIQSIHNKVILHQIHSNIDDKKLNELLNEFIDNDIFRSLCVSKIIQKCIFPK